MLLAPAFTGLSLGMSIAQEILQRRAQKRAKPAALGIGSQEKITFQDHEKEILGEILRILFRVPLATDEGKDRPPIDPAELRQRFARLGFFGLPIERG